MNLYYNYFNQELHSLPYKDDREAEGEVMALADCCVRAAFYGKEHAGSRLDMRGLVITPDEVEEALLEHCLNQRDEEKIELLELISSELSMVFDHLLKRYGNDSNTRIGKLVRAFGLGKKETFFFFLTLCCELDRKYERLYGYLQDNVAVRLPTRGLLESLWNLFGDQGELVKDDSPLWRYLIDIRDSAVRPGSWISEEFFIYPGIYGYIRNGNFSGRPWDRVITQEESELGLSLKVSLKPAGILMKVEEKMTKCLASLLACACLVEDANICLTGSFGEAEGGNLASLEEFMTDFGCVYRWDDGSESLRLKPGAVRVPVVYEWGDLILEEEPKLLLRQVCGQIHDQDTVQNLWGFGRKSPYGNGVSALFYGPPGTGKTMAAQVIANELGMGLFKVDISQMVSKYIGETEKNFSQLFEKAAKIRAVLFFDEADGLFSARTEVRNSNDRYANMETGYLLQKFEEYDGVSILATNFVSHIDDAFKRRIKFLIKFSLPGPKTRLSLWKSMIPDTAVIDEELCLEAYARNFEIPGSAIREIVTNAAFLAAGEKTGIRNRHIRQALKVYYLKYGRTVTEMELERCGG